MIIPSITDSNNSTAFSMSNNHAINDSSNSRITGNIGQFTISRNQASARNNLIVHIQCNFITIKTNLTGKLVNSNGNCLTYSIMITISNSSNSQIINTSFQTRNSNYCTININNIIWLINNTSNNTTGISK